MIKRKYTDEYKIIAENFANSMIDLILSLGVKIENTENQKKAIVNNIKQDLRRNIPNIHLFEAQNSVQRMNVVNDCKLLDLLELVELLNPDNLRIALMKEFQLTCSIIETLTLSPSQRSKVVSIKKSTKAFKALWKPFQEYYSDMLLIKPLIVKIYEFQTQEHVKEKLNLYTSNPKMSQWILSVKKHPHYQSEFKKYVGHLRNQDLSI